MKGKGYSEEQIIYALRKGVSVGKRLGEDVIATFN